MARHDEATLVRPCAEADIDAVIRLQQQWSEESITYGLVPGHTDALLAHLGPYFLVAEQDERVVAYAYGSLRRGEGSAVIPADDAYLEIEEVYVEADYRQCGIGSDLLRRLMAAARTQGIERFLLSSATKDMEAVLKFYRRLGFRPWYVTLFQ